MNPKMVRLLHEGFSISTLENLTEGQLNLLYEKTKKVKKEPKEAEQVTKTITATKYKPEEIAQFKNPDGSYSIPQSEGEVTERAKSKKQQQFFGIVRGMQKGEIPKKGEAGKKAKEMDPKDVKDFASTKHKGLPKKVESKEGSEKFIQKATKKIEKKGTEGKFGRWCKKEGLDSDGEVTKKCISAAMKSDDPAVVKMANFAKNIGGFKGSEHKKKTESKENVKKLEENILRLIEDYLPPHTTKGELLRTIKSIKR